MTLKDIVRHHYLSITDGVAWVVISKINRRWNYAEFYKHDGSYEDGLSFNNDDIVEMQKIAKADPKAICINSAINGFENLTMSELENKIRSLYELRYCQLNGDFLGLIVKISDKKGK